MAVLPGFGVNYKGAQASWAKDKAYFKKIKDPSTPFVIRPNLSYIAYPWVAGDPSVVGSNAYWRECAKYFAADPDFYVIWGPAGIVGQTVGSLTATMWSQYHDSVIAEATYLQSQGIALGLFEEDNEIERFVDHDTLSEAQCRANLRQLATDIKAVYTLSPVVHSAYHLISGTNLQGWINEGLGGLDFFAHHCYAASNITTKVVTDVGFSYMASLIAAFGNKYLVSEFNLDTNAPNIAGLDVPTRLTAMQKYLDQMAAMNVPKFVFYSWVGNLNGNDQFAQLFVNGGMSPTWGKFFASRPLQYTKRVASVSRSSATRAGNPLRAATPVRLNVNE